MERIRCESKVPINDVHVQVAHYLADPRCTGMDGRTSGTVRILEIVAFALDSIHDACSVPCHDRRAVFFEGIRLLSVSTAICIHSDNTFALLRRLLNLPVDITASSLRRWANTNHYRPASSKKAARLELVDRAA